VLPYRLRHWLTTQTRWIARWNGPRTTGPVVLAGHAYAGAVIGSTKEDRVKALVYVAALAPDQHGFIWMPEGGFCHAVAHKASAVQRPIALKCIQTPAPRLAWRTKPTWFLLAEEARMISPETQRFMADRMGARVEAHQRR